MSDLRIRHLDTDVLVVGSGAGGAVTAATLAAAGRSVTVVEEGPWVDPDAMEPFSLEEICAKYRHRGLSAALGKPSIVYAEGRCVGGSTEINSALFPRLPEELAEEWRVKYAIEAFASETLAHYADVIETDLTVSKLPFAPPVSSALLERGAAKLGWRSVEFPRLFRYEGGRATKQTMTRTFIPRAVDAGARIISDCRVERLLRHGAHVVGARCVRHGAEGDEPITIHADHVFVCGGAVQTPALLQRSGIRRRIGVGLKLHPMIKIAARFPFELDHGDVPMHRITEFAPDIEIGGSASRRGQIAMALADSDADYRDAMAQWSHVGVYYAAIRDGHGRVIAVPGLRAPVVTYRLTDADLSRLARGLVHLGEALLAAGATELYPSVSGAAVVRRPEDLAKWWDAVTRTQTNLMTVHLASTIRMGENRALTAADSFGRVWGSSNLRVNDASLLPGAPGVNPQSAIMMIAARNCDEFLGTA
ncbi:MAG: GMC family oxidoreductase [Actinomycetota bacterium]|nr:GMC family oxidoreductase [Actinomycetota bacterium]